MDDFERHFAACNNARLPGERLPLRIGAGAVGWVRPALAQELQQFAGVLVAPDAVTLLPEAADGLQEIAETLAERGHFRWRGEPFDVRAGASGPVLAQLDRGALPAFGVLAHGFTCGWRGAARPSSSTPASSTISWPAVSAPA
jgi:hypothetical protein